MKSQLVNGEVYETDINGESTRVVFGGFGSYEKGIIYARVNGSPRVYTFQEFEVDDTKLIIERIFSVTMGKNEKEYLSKILSRRGI